MLTTPRKRKEEFGDMPVISDQGEAMEQALRTSA